MRWLALCVVGFVLPTAVVRAADPPKGQIVYSRKEGDRYVLHVMNADGTGDRILPGQTASLNVFPTWSPDGKQIAWTSADALEGNSFQIRIANVDGTGQKGFNAPQNPAGLFTWSPDGKQLAFMAGEGAGASVYVSDSLGNGARQLNPPGTQGIFPFWLIDGKVVGYTRIKQGDMGSELVLAKVDGSGETVLSQSDKLTFAGANAPSPDGKRLLTAVVDTTTRAMSIRMWDLPNRVESGFDDLPLPQFDSPAAFATAAWAPDGKSFLITLRTEKGAGVFRVTVDGKERTRLTPEGMDCHGAAWYGPR